VLDNSVAMRWCFESGAHPYADSILDRLATGDTAMVPVLWFYEASAVLSRAQNIGTRLQGGGVHHGTPIP
jgi:hypothetical protein